MGGYTDKDTASYSGDSLSQVAEAEHNSRDAAAKDSGVNFKRGDRDTNSKPLLTDQVFVDKDTYEKKWSDDNSIAANISRFFGGNG